MIEIFLKDRPSIKIRCELKEYERICEKISNEKWCGLIDRDKKAAMFKSDDVEYIEWTKKD